MQSSERFPFGSRHRTPTNTHSRAINQPTNTDQPRPQNDEGRAGRWGVLSRVAPTAPPALNTHPFHPFFWLRILLSVFDELTWLSRRAYWVIGLGGASRASPRPRMSSHLKGFLTSVPKNVPPVSTNNTTQPQTNSHHQPPTNINHQVTTESASDNGQQLD